MPECRSTEAWISQYQVRAIDAQLMFTCCHASITHHHSKRTHHQPAIGWPLGHPTGHSGWAVGKNSTRPPVGGRSTLGARCDVGTAWPAPRGPFSALLAGLALPDAWSLCSPAAIAAPMPLWWRTQAWMSRCWTCGSVAAGASGSAAERGRHKIGPGLSPDPCLPERPRRHGFRKSRHPVCLPPEAHARCSRRPGGSPGASNRAGRTLSKATAGRAAA